MRRVILKQIQLLPLLSPSRPSLSSLIPRFSNFHIDIFSHAFRRTLLEHSHTLLPSLHFSTSQPSSIQPAYTPLDFNHLESTNNLNDELAVLKIVELMQKTKGFTSNEEAIDYLVNSGINPDEDKFYLAIWKLRDDWKLALLAFEMMGKWGAVSEKISSLIVWVLGTHQKFDIAWSLIRDLHRIVDTQRAMLCIIERYAAANNHDKAIKTFHFMEKLSLLPDQNAFYSVISSLCRYGNVEEAEDFMLTNKKLYPLQTEGFNIILHGWCVISLDIVEAKRVWREMANYCITPNAMSYSHMISCFSKVGNLFDSLRLYDGMKKRGFDPGLDVYNSLIYVMARENCLSEALKIFEKIKEVGLQPDIRSYNSLIGPLCDGGKFDEARNLISVMKQEGVRPTIETYKALLSGADLEGTFEILNQMKDDKVGPDNETFVLVFDKFFELREPENALKVWVEMRDFGVQPEQVHYKSLICGLANRGCLVKAKELQTEMLSNGYVDDPKLKKFLEGPKQGIYRVNKSNYVSAHRGRIKQGGKSSKKRGKT